MDPCRVLLEQHWVKADLENVSLIQKDARSITGSNLRNIMVEVGKDDVLKLVKSDTVNLKYHPLEKDEEWKHMVLSDFFLQLLLVLMEIALWAHFSGFGHHSFYFTR